jgi:two-component system LytT family response regulator
MTTNKMKAMVVDDEVHARLTLKGILSENFSTMIEVVAEAENVPEAVKAIHKYKPDVVFLDIEMPAYNGFELLDFFDAGQIHFQIVFVTAYSEYSLRAFEISATDYLLKPVRFAQIERAVGRLWQNFTQNRYQNARLEVLKEHLTRSPADKKIVLQTAENMYIVHLHDILYAEADGSYTHFFTKMQGKITITKKLSDFDYLEEMGSFMRTHRSYLVNLNKIKRVDKKNFVIVMENDTEVYLAQDRKPHLLQKLMPDSA